VHANGRAVKACSLLAVQAQGMAITTIEGIGDAVNLHPMQASFREHHGLQCGFCTPGMIMQAIDLVEHTADLNNQSIRAGLKGNLCRCTGYHNIVRAVQAVADSAKSKAKT
jgi:carbon-monoxide dehydrogenase small subunit